MPCFLTIINKVTNLVQPGSISAPLNYFKAGESWYCGGKGHPASSNFWWGKTLLQNGVGCYFKISPLGHDSVLIGNLAHSVVTKLPVTTASHPRTQSHMIMYLQNEKHWQNLRCIINHIQTDQSTLSRQGYRTNFLAMCQNGIHSTTTLQKREIQAPHARNRSLKEDQDMKVKHS
jgi:hypothetical protein